MSTVNNGDYGYQLEGAIVGGMLSWPKYIGQATSILSPEDFTDHDMRKVFEAITGLFLRGEPVDDTLFVEPGDLVVVGGYSSAGKTLLSLQFALHMARTRRVGYFSLETDRRKLGDRMVSHYAQIGFRSIKQGTETGRDIERAVKMGMEVSEFSGGMGVHRLRAASVRDIRTLTLRYRYQVVFIDYMQLLHSEGRSRYEQITRVSLDLRELAQGGVTVIALAQLARPETAKGKAQEPGLWSFKESGQIENDADVAMLLYRADDTDNFSPRVLKIAKNKDGELKKILLDFDGAYQTMRPMDPTKAEKFQAVNKAIKSAAKARQGQDPAEQVTFSELRGEDDNLPF